ncbi:MAG: DUF89 family protein [Clostridia bacterium]|nr:DUF89 family protein [Clostridia bacterium]
MQMTDVCVRCVRDKHLSRVPADALEDKAAAYRARVNALLASRGKRSAPEIVWQIENAYREAFGSTRDFTEIKHYYNRKMLGMEEAMWQEIRKTPDPVKRAMQYAVMGNFIDFSAQKDVEESTLDSLLLRSEEIALPADVMQAFRQALEKASSLVYLTDNCGEIVTDKILIRALQAQYPRLAVTALVRGAPVANDATREDAEETGLCQVCTVAENGNGIAGTVPDRLSPEARCCLQGADVILSKGQGNYETLCGEGFPVFYLFMCKCAMFTQRFAVPLYTAVFTGEGI